MANNRLCNCTECGKQFAGWPNSLYCPECARERRKASHRKAAEKRRQIAKIARVEKAATKPVAKKPDTEQCKECIYWRPLSSTSGYGTGVKCCHYILDTEKRRKRDGDKCLSRTTDEPRTKRPWTDYV